MIGEDDSKTVARGGLGAMEGGGFYTAHSAPQGSYGELGFQWLEEAAAAVAPAGPLLPFVIADMGAAGGGNSLEPMRRAIDVLRRNGQRPILVAHTDIPSNDFSALFELIGSSPRSYAQAPDVYTVAIGRSFFDRLLPAEYLSLGWSSIAVHWLSRLPQPIPEHIYCSFATGAVRDALQARSAADWRQFLVHRAIELRPGARMIIIGGAAEPTGASGAEGLMTMANDALQAMVADGQLTAAEYNGMTIPTWNRTEEAFLEPFTAEALQDRLALRRHVFRTLPDPYFAAFEKDADLTGYTASVTAFFEAAFGPSLWASLNPEPGAEGRAQVVDEFGRRLASAVAADPRAAACSWHTVTLDIERVS